MDSKRKGQMEILSVVRNPCWLSCLSVIFSLINDALFHFALFQFSVSDEGKTTLSEAIKEGTDMPTLYYAVAAQKYLGIQGNRSDSQYATNVPAM